MSAFGILLVGVLFSMLLLTVVGLVGALVWDLVTSLRSPSWGSAAVPVKSATAPTPRFTKPKLVTQ